MTAYNTEMNRRIYEAASRLDDAARRLDRGAFFGSIHGTLNHLLWADTLWMSRFAGSAPPAIGLDGSPCMVEDFTELRTQRLRLDQALLDWARSLADDWLAEEMEWTSLAAKRAMRHPRALLIMHFFNHQTHHRGQVHAMLTAAGEDTGDTDLHVLIA
jgi:uncharacterized damage-inducible protein DinB